MTDKNQYLFLFTIGPVQSFIAQARKTQDLYAGSQILTKLACRGLEEAVLFHQAKPIFPFDIKAVSLPNRFLVSVESNDVKAIGQKIEAVVRAYWKEEVCAEVITFDESRKQYNGIKGVAQQIETHLDIHWAFVEITEGYQKAYEKIERLLGAVKNARSFEQFDYQGQLGEKGRKCSLDGERNVKFYRLNETERADDVLVKKLFTTEEEVCIINNADERDFHFSKLQAGEGLSAVSMVKRKFNAGNTFRSTSDIAMLYSIRYLFNFKDAKSVELARKVCNYRQIFDKANRSGFNAQLYFEENLTVNYFKKQGFKSLNLQIRDLEKQRKEIDTIAKDAGYPFLKYYAIIDFDGDSMGKWLSGDRDKLKEGIDLKDFHKDLSSKLADFAKEAKKIVDNYGQTVYAGGDDFLGFVNLNYLFKAMKELINKYEELVNLPLAKYRQAGQNLSFSAGVCIAHYKEPLSMVLDKAAKAQKTAKHDEKGRRNAFSIMASKHSGENHEAYFNWGTDCENVEHLECIVKQLITENSFSNTFIKSLNIEFAKLTNNKGELLVSKDILEEEVKRLAYRSCMLERNKGESSEDFKTRKKKESKCLTIHVMALFQRNNFENFINALNICDFMHRLIATGSDMDALKQTEKELCATL